MRIAWLTALAKGVYHYFRSEESPPAELSVSETQHDELPLTDATSDDGLSIFDDSDGDLVSIDETPTVELPFGIEIDEEFPFVYPFDTDFILVDEDERMANEIDLAFLDKKQSKLPKNPISDPNTKLLVKQKFSSVDFLLRKNDLPVFLEINTIPGLTSRSLLPRACQSVGIDFLSLCERLLLQALYRFGTGQAYHQIPVQHAKTEIQKS